MNPVSSCRALAAPIAIVVTLALAACGGSGFDQDKVKSVQDQGVALQKKGADLQAQAARLKADVASGKLTQHQADAKLKAATDAITQKAAKVSSAAIDSVKDANIPDAAKKQLDAAQKQLDATTTP